MTSLIDVHHHILPPFYLEALEKAGIPKKYGITLPNWSINSSLEMMEKYNIESAITSISTPGVCLGDVDYSKNLARMCNDFASELSAKYPNTFGGFATLPLPYINEAVKEITYAIETLRMEGVTLLSNYDGLLLGNEIFHPIFRKLNELHTTVFIHPTIPSPCCAEMNTLPASMFEFICDSSRTIIHMLFAGIFEKYSNIRFIIPHAGGVIPYLAGRLNLYETLMPHLKKNIPQGVNYYLQKLYYDTAMSTSAATLGCLKEFIPIENILLGTDYPFVIGEGIDKQLNLFNEYPHFNATEKEMICQGNMRRLFPRFKKKS